MLSPITLPLTFIKEEHSYLYPRKIFTFIIDQKIRYQQLTLVNKISGNKTTQLNKGKIIIHIFINFRPMINQILAAQIISYNLYLVQNFILSIISALIWYTSKHFLIGYLDDLWRNI